MNEGAFWAMVIGFIGVPLAALLGFMLEGLIAYRRDELSFRRWLRAPLLGYADRPTAKMVAALVLLWAVSIPVLLFTGG